MCNTVGLICRTHRLCVGDAVTVTDCLVSAALSFSEGKWDHFSFIGKLVESWLASC